MWLRKLWKCYSDEVLVHYATILALRSGLPLSGRVPTPEVRMARSLGAGQAARVPQEDIGNACVIGGV